MKQGAIQIQFTWLFIMIAGAVILLVFFGFVLKQRSAAETALADSISRDIEAIASGAGIARGASQEVAIGRRDITLNCEEDCTCDFGVGGVTKAFKDKILFGPRSLEGGTLVFLNLDWAVPFRVTNFVYLTTKDVKYYLIFSPEDGFSTGLKDRLVDVFPESISFESVPVNRLNTIGFEDFDHSRFVFLNLPTSNLQTSLDDSFDGESISSVGITQNTVTFNEKNGGVFKTTTHPYFGDAALIGGVFAEQEAMYRCNMQNALKRLKFVAQVYSERAAELDTQNLETCGYQEGLTLLEDISSFAEEKQFAFVPPFNIPSLEELNRINKKLLVNGCPVLF